MNASDQNTAAHILQEGAVHICSDPYTVEGSKLTISPAGTTMMACPPALMDQERKLVDLLGKVSSYSIDHTGLCRPMNS